MTDYPTDTLDLRGYLRPLRSRWWIVVLVAVAAASCTYVYYDRKPPRYSSTTSVLLSPEEALNADPERLAREQAVILRTRAIARLVARELGVASDPRSLPGSVTAAPEEGTDFLTLTSVASDSATAVALVNAYARVYVRYSGETGRRRTRDARVAAESRLREIPDTPENRLTRLQLESTIQSLGVQENTSRSNAQQIEPAVASNFVGASPERHALFALVLGAVLGIALAYALEHLDRRVKRLEDISVMYDAPMLVAVPNAPVAGRASGSDLTIAPGMTEAFRTLRNTLQLQVADSAAGNGEPLRTLLVTSALAGEGKSTVVRNLALAYYEAGLRVAVVDADLRRPTLAANFGLDPEPGLADVLRGKPLTEGIRFVGHRPEPPRVATTAITARAAAIGESGRLGRLRRPVGGKGQSGSASSDADRAAGVANGRGDIDTDGGITIVTSGRPLRDPSALLATGPIDDVLRDLAASHDIVIVDTSPLLPVSDAVPLLAAVDGVLLVSRIGVTTGDAVKRLLDLLARVSRVNVVGVVANDVREQVGYSYGYSNA